jgi:hypothetical protein
MRCLDEAFLLQPVLLASICAHAEATASGETRGLRRAQRASLRDLHRRADGRTGLAQPRLDVGTRVLGRHGHEVPRTFIACARNVTDQPPTS